MECVRKLIRNVTICVCQTPLSWPSDHVCSLLICEQLNCFIAHFIRAKKSFSVVTRFLRFATTSKADAFVGVLALWQVSCMITIESFVGFVHSRETKLSIVFPGHPAWMVVAQHKYQASAGLLRIAPNKSICERGSFTCCHSVLNLNRLGFGEKQKLAYCYESLGSQASNSSTESDEEKAEGTRG